MDLAVPKIMFLENYLIIYCKLRYTYSLKGDNYYAKITVSPV